jgi:hypothetical protein
VKTLLSIKSALEMTKPKKFTPLRSDMFPIVCRYPIQVVIPFMWRRIFPSSVSFFFPYFLPSKVTIYKSRSEVQSISFARENIKKLPSKYFCSIAENFSTCNRPKTSPNIKFCTIKMSHRATYI